MSRVLLYMYKGEIHTEILENQRKMMQAVMYRPANWLVVAANDVALKQRQAIFGDTKNK